MAKRLSKALRGKRRWVGVLVDPALDSREKVETCLEALCKTISIESVRLMDFLAPNERIGREVEHENSLTNDQPGGIAILQVPLKHINQLRDALQQSEAMGRHGMVSLSTSGKIRLVRERLGLPKPQRNR